MGQRGIGIMAGACKSKSPSSKLGAKHLPGERGWQDRREERSGFLASSELPCPARPHSSPAYSQLAPVVPPEERMRCCTHSKVTAPCVHQDIQLGEEKWRKVSAIQAEQPKCARQHPVRDNELVPDPPTAQNIIAPGCIMQHHIS